MNFSARFAGIARLVLVATVSLIAIAPSAHAQRLAPQAVTRQTNAIDRTTTPQTSLLDSATSNTAPMAFFGTIAGVVGAVGGGFLGGIISCAQAQPYDDMCGLGAIPGAFLGEPLGVALGVHFAGPRHGNLALETLASMGILASGLALAAGVHNAAPAVLILPLQVAVTIAMEKSAESRHRAHQSPR